MARLESGRTSPSFDSVVRLVQLCGYGLHVSLDRYDESDVAQAEALLDLSVDERINRLEAGLSFAQELRDAYRDAVEA